MLALLITETQESQSVGLKLIVRVASSASDSHQA